MLANLIINPLARSLFALALLMALGIAGYMAIEGWSALDAAYMVVLTFTTVGYREVHPLSPAGRVFTMFVMVGGVGMMLYILSSVVNLAVTNEIVGLLVSRHRRRTRMKKLDRHFIVCGFGRVGRAVASTLRDNSLPLIIMDKDADALAEADAEGMLYMQGDPTREADLLAAQIDRAAGLVAATGDDAENVYISLTARGLNPRLAPRGRREAA